MNYRQGGHQSSVRTRRAAAESGAFGRSTRRSRSKTGTPARREDPTVQSADKIFGEWINKQSQPGTATTTPQRKQSIPASISLPNILSTSADDAATSVPSRAVSKVPTEVILRGYKSHSQQYAAINHYEQLAGRICEDYSRDPPVENRRYKSELRDPAFTRRRALTAEERSKVNRVDGGEHWVKVTFESLQAAEAAISTSPQTIFGYLVYAEPYHGIAPSRDEPIPDATTAALGDELPRSWRRPGTAGNRTAGELRPSFTTSSLPREIVAGEMDTSPSQSQTSSRTVESGTVTTLNTMTSSTATVTGQDAAQGLTSDPNSEYCRRIPTARKIRFMPAEQALMPQQSYTQRVLNHVPFLKWFSGSMIGNEVPRTDLGEFDWDKASLYWKFIWWLDSTFRLFGGEILNADKDD